MELIGSRINLSRFYGIDVKGKAQLQRIVNLTSSITGVRQQRCEKCGKWTLKKALTTLNDPTHVLCIGDTELKSLGL